MECLLGPCGATPLERHSAELTVHGVEVSVPSIPRATDPRARIYAYQDDADVVANPSACAAARQTFSAAAAEAGLRANPGKETVTPGRQVTPTDLPAGFPSAQDRQFSGTA